MILQGGVPVKFVVSVAPNPGHIVVLPLSTAVLEGMTVTTALPCRLSLNATHPILSLKESKL